MKPNRVRAIFLAALMVTMTLSQISMNVEQEQQAVESLEQSPQENTQFVANSNPMSNIFDAVQFSETVDSSISGYSDYDPINGGWGGPFSSAYPQYNDSISTGVGGGDGNQWWKTATIGDQFTVNLSVDEITHPNLGYYESSTNYSSWELGYYTGLHMEVITNAGSCGKVNWNGWTGGENVSLTCDTPESGGMVYIRLSVIWHGDELEANFNYTLEVAEYTDSNQVDDSHCDDEDGHLGLVTRACDSTQYWPIIMGDFWPRTASGTMEDIYDVDYVRITDGLPMVQRMNMTVTRTSDSGPYLYQYSGLDHCHSGSITMSSESYKEYLDCVITIENPEVQIERDWGDTGSDEPMDWSVSYTLTNILPIEDAVTGDIPSLQAKVLPVNSTAEGSIGFTAGESGWEYDQWGNYVYTDGTDSSDHYDVSLLHGYRVDFKVSSDADIVVSIPEDETCNGGTVNDIQVQADLPLRLSCTSYSSYDFFRIGLVTTSTTNGTANYSITSMVGTDKIETGVNPTINDLGTGIDAPATNGWSGWESSGEGSSLTVPLGTSTGSFTHITDLRDSFKVEVPPNQGRIVFIKADEMSISGGWWQTHGDLRYQIMENNGDEMLTNYFQISPNDDQSWVRQSEMSFSPDKYTQQEYTISVHEFDIASESLGEWINSHEPDYLTGNQQLTIPAFVPTGNLSDWGVSSATTTLMMVDLEIDPTQTLTVTAEQASGEPIGIRLENSHSSIVYEWFVNEFTVHNFFEGHVESTQYYSNVHYYDYDSHWYSARFTGLDGSAINITTTYSNGYSSSNTVETDTWFASPTQLSGALGMSVKEGWDNGDEWTITVEEDRFYEITLETDDGLEAQFGDNGVVSGCWSGDDWDPDGEDYAETRNQSYWVYLWDGSGEYTLNYDRGPVGSCDYTQLGFIDTPSDGTPGEDVFFEISNNDWMMESNLKLDLADLQGNDVGSMQIMHIDNETAWSRNVRATVPYSIEDGTYVVQLKYNGLIVDTAQIDINFFGWLNVQSISSSLQPNESPSWLVNLRSHGEENPGEWEFSLGDTWMRDVDGTIVHLDSTQLTTASSDVGMGIVGTELSMQPRPGAVIEQSAVISSSAGSAVKIAEEVEVERSWTMDKIDLALSSPIGTSIMTSNYIDDEIGYVREFTTTAENPSNDIFYTICANCGGIPFEGISGVANLYGATGSTIRQTQSFETNEWGQAGIMFDYSALPSGNYTVMLDVDDEWDDWVSSIPAVSFFTINSNWNGVDGGVVDVVETDFDLTANIRRSTLIAGEDIQIDWSVDSAQPVREVAWILQDSAGRILATDSILQSESSGLLEITIPQSLDTPLYSTITMSVRGAYGSVDSVIFTIDNINQNTNLVVNVNPDLVRSGDTLTVDLELDSDVDYIYWSWSLVENGGVIDSGDGWKADTSAQFEIELDRRTFQNLALVVSVIDGHGNTYSDSQPIQLRDLVELSVQSAFIINAGETLSLNWEVVSPSLTVSDKATVIGVSLVNVVTSEIVYEETQLVDGFEGKFGLDVPIDTRPGTYLMAVYVETADGQSLTSESVIDVDEPREKNMILGIEFPSWSSMFNGFAVLFLIGNLVAIWVVIYRRKGPGGSKSDFDLDKLLEEGDEEDSGFGAGYDQIYGSTNESSGGSIRPSPMLNGVVQDDGYEWVMHPEGSDIWWYRQESGMEWTRH